MSIYPQHKGKVNWVWYGTFKGLKSSINDIKKLKKHLDPNSRLGKNKLFQA